MVVEAQQNVKGYFGTAPSLVGRVDQDVDYEMEGSSATIGISDGGNKAQRLAARAGRRHLPLAVACAEHGPRLFGGG